MIYLNGYLYVISGTGEYIQVDPCNAANNTVMYNTDPILSMDVIPGDPNNLLVGDYGSISTMDIGTGEQSPLCNSPGTPPLNIYNLASNTNNGGGGPNCPPTLDLDGNDSSGAPFGNYNPMPYNCLSAGVPVADVDAAANSGSPINQMTVTLTGILDPPHEVLVLNGSFPNLTVSGSGTDEVTLTNANGNASIADFLAALTAIVYQNNAPGLTPGQRLATVSFDNTSGQTSNQAIAFINVEASLNTSGSVNPSTDCTAPNGSIDLSVNPTGNYQYEWSNGATTQDVGPLGPGTYSVTISPAAPGGCTATATFEVLEEVAAPDPAPTPTAANCGLSDGAVNLAVGGGAPPFTFLWSNGATTEDLGNVPAGSYSVTVTGANGCTATASATVPNNDIAIGISGSALPNTSCAAANGSVNIAPSPQSPPSGSYTFAWSNGATSEDIAGLAAGTYTVTVSYGSTCTASASFPLANEPALPGLTATPGPANCGLPDGTVDLAVAGGLAPFTFAWSNGPTTEDLANVPPGNYAVTVTGANGCTATASATVPDNPVSIGITGTTTPAPNGSVDITASPANGYNYAWSNGETTEDISGLAAGTYTVTVTLGTGCTATASFVVGSFNPPPLVITGVALQDTCNLGLGAIYINVSGGTPPYTFTWSNGANTEDIFNLTAGSYWVFVEDSNGESQYFYIDVPNFTNIGGPNFDYYYTWIQYDNSVCIGPPNGGWDYTQITSLPFTWLWSNGVTTEDNLGLGIGYYSAIVTLGTCNLTYSVGVVLNDPDAPVLNASPTNATCGQSNGTIDLTVTESEPPYTYAWSNGASTEDVANLAPGTYTVTVTGANGCTEEGSWAIGDVVPFAVSGAATPASSCTVTNGAVDLTPSPPGSYTFSWSNGSGTEDLANIPAGTYAVTVSDANGCTATNSFTVEDTATPPSLSATTTAATCGQNNGSINLTPSGGTAPYAFAWSNGANTEDLSGVPAGSYTVTVTGANGCTATASATVPDNPVSIGITGTTTPAPNGSVDITASPANGYDYAWSNGETTEDISGLAAGTYTVTVTLGTGCTATASFVVGSAGPLEISGTVYPDTCDLNFGAIDLTVSGGTPPFAFSWSNGATTEDLSGIGPGSYTVTVVDANGETLSMGFVVDNVVDIVGGGYYTGVVTQNTVCVGQPNGSIVYTPLTSLPFLWQWSNGVTGPSNTNLPAGFYSATVTLGSCFYTEFGTSISDFFDSPELLASIVDAACGSPTGSIDLTVTDGEPPFAFVWSNGATTEDIGNLTPNLYTVTVTGANGCTAIGAYIVEDVPTLALSGTTVPNNSCQAPNGMVDLAPSPPGNHAYAWSNGAATEDVDGLAPGTYGVTVSDAIGCTATAVFTVEDVAAPPVLAVSTAPATCGLPSGSATISPSGGAAPFSYTWSNGGTAATIDNVPGGSYTVTVTGANGCSGAATATIVDAPYSFSITGTPTPNTACAGENGAISVSVSPAWPPVGDYIYLWSNGLASPDASPLPGGDYSLTVSLGSCASTAGFTVADQPAELVLNVTTTPPSCGSADGTVDLTVSSGTAPFGFTWDNGSTSEDLNGVAAGTYSVTVVSNATGCMASATAVVDSSGTSDTTVVSAFSCDPTEVGTFIQTFATGNGCDSIVVTTVSFSAADTTAIFGTSCDPGEVGVFEQLFTNSNACDSLVVTTVTYLASDTTAIFGTSCDPVEVGVFEQLFTNQSGCDSLVVTTVSFAAADTTAIFGTSCNPGEVGVFEQLFTNQNGCDSLVVTTVAFSTSDTTAIFGTSCDPGEVGVFEQVFTNSNGCDSLVVTTVAFSAADTTAIYGTSCDPGEVGVFEQLFTNSNGCDSLVVTTVELLPSASTAIAATTCDPSQAGTFVQNLATWQGCDSTVTTTVALLPSASTNIAATTCDPTQAGTFVQNLATWQGCDSTVTTTVALLPSASTAIAATTCDPSQAGTFTQNLATWQGCDSTVTTTVALLPSASTAIAATTCDPSAAGTFTQNLATWQGCDSTVTTTVTLLPSTSTSLTSTTCDPTQSGVFIQNLSTWQGCDSTVTTTITWTPPPTLAVAASDFGGFGVSCAGASDGWALASASGTPPFQFAWQGGATSPLLDGLPPGVYAVTVVDANGCSSETAIQIVGPEPLANALGISALGCFDDSSGAVTATATGGVPPYLFSLGSGQPQPSGTFGGLGAGAYVVTVMDANSCSASDLVAINAPVPLSVELGEDLFLVLGDGTALSALASVPWDSLAQVDWSGVDNPECPQCPAQQVFPVVTTAYSVTVVDGLGCSASDGLTVYVDRTKSVYVPNAFSPNGDGINDLLTVFARGEQVRRVRSFLVFDRWGESVYRYFDFQPNDPATGWDGTYRGLPLNPAVFAWLAEVEFVDGEVALFKGDVVLVR